METGSHFRQHDASLDCIVLLWLESDDMQGGAKT